MLKKTITYPDLDGNMITEDFYFNLSKAELAEMELVERDGMEAKLRRIIATDDRRELLQAFKDIIRRSYGVRSEDGKSFIKNDALADIFMGTEAYAQLFISFFENAENAVEFINGIVPADLRQEAEKLEKTQTATDEIAVVKKDPKEMTREELLAAFKEKNDSRSSTTS